MSSSHDRSAPLLVISDDEARLDGTKSAYFAALGPGDVRRWGNSHRWLPGLPRHERSATLDDYLRCADEIDAYNYAKPAYWRTALGIRDVEKSRFFNGLDQLWRLRHLFRKAQEGSGDIALLVSDAGFAKLAGELAAKNAWRVSIRLGPRWPRWWSRLHDRWQGLRYVLSLAAPLGARRRSVPESADIIVATVSTLKRIQSTEGPKDFIFGQLPDQLVAKGKNIAMFAQLVGETRRPDDGAPPAAAFPIRSFGDLTGPFDAIWSFCRALLSPIRAPAITSALGLNVKALIRSDIERARWQDLPANMLLERALSRLIKRSPKAVLLHSFENNAWESVCQDLARRFGIKSVGLQHNALIRSHLKLYRNARRPAPDAIIVSGPVYQRLLRDEFGYDSARVVCGFAVRQFDIYSNRAKTSPPGEPQRILVMLQEALTSPLFLDLVGMAFKGAKGLTVTLRSHPAVPIAEILQNSRLRLRPPFRKSTSQSLYDDLDSHDVAVCGGTTAELEAVAFGVPCVFVDTGETVPANPLFAEPALNTVASDAIELRAACEKLAALPVREFADQHRAARAFVEGAFRAPTARAFDKILETLTPNA
jgi:hypothetical protein